MSSSLVWYCVRCRKVIKSDPPRADIPKECTCRIPQIEHPTKVWHDRTW